MLVRLSVCLNHIKGTIIIIIIIKICRLQCECSLILDIYKAVAN